MKLRNILAGIATLIILMPTTLTSCIKEDELLTDEVELLFSCDTVTFDTVFTTIGSTTRQLMVYNPYDQPVSISSIGLEGGRQSRFRLNVDGDTSIVARDILLAAHDSLFVFIQANINPNSMLEPFLVEDRIVVQCNGRNQQVVLTAYGRNAVYHRAAPGHWTSIIDCEHWDHSLPHVILGYAAVDSLCTLRLEAGDELYFGTGATLLVYNGATLEVQGSPEKPVLFTSMRHDGWYDTLPGQWNYIWLYQGSRNNVIDWAVIENGNVGLLVDTNVTAHPTLTITNTRVRNHYLAGILGQGAWIEGDNLLVTNCGTATLALQYGGRYRFRNSTFADFWRYGGAPRKNPSVIINNFYTVNNRLYGRPLELVEFDNCIIDGNYSTATDTMGEILLDLDPAVGVELRFRNCLLRSRVVEDYAQGCLFCQEPMWDTAKGREWHVAAESPAVGLASWEHITLPHDLDNQPRRTPPTAGAFELQP